MSRKIFSFTLLFIFFYLSSIANISAGIEGAEPRYDYREFLSEDLNYEFSIPADSPVTVPEYSLTWKQEYFHNYSTSSSLNWQDTLVNTNIGVHYWHDIQQSSFSFGYRDDHQVKLHYYNWEHKKYLGLADLELSNSLTFFFLEKSQFYLRNNLQYLFHHESISEVMENDLKDLSLSGDLGFYTTGWGLVNSYQFPFRHDWERYRLSTAYYGLWDPFLLGVGLSFTEDESSRLYPYITARYNYGNRVIVRMKLKEEFVSYPYRDHFREHRLLWRSFLPEMNKDIDPYPEKVFSAGADLFMLGFLQQINLIYRRSDRRFDYLWNEDIDPYFTIISRDKQQESFLIDYSLSYKGSQFHLSYLPQDRIDFQPLISVGLAQKITHNVFNELLVALDYHYREKTMTWSESVLDNRIDNYLLTGINYRYTKIKNLTLEGGINYPILRPGGSYYDINPDFFMTISYGTKRNESSY